MYGSVGETDSGDRGVVMPLTEKGKEILAQMKKNYGPKKGTRIFYASQRKGTIKGTHKKK